MSAARSSLFLVATLAAACGGPSFDPQTAKHVLTVDERGRMLDTAASGAPPAFPAEKNAVYQDDTPSGQTTEKLVDEMVKGILAGTESHLAHGGRRRVMIFAHGGLNSWDASSDTIRDVLKRVHWSATPPAGQPPDPYPIFVQWNSEAFHCLHEHLWWIRQGRVRDRFWPLASPLYFVGDLGRGLVDLPVTWMTEIENTFGTAPSMKENAKERYKYYRGIPVDDARLGRGERPDRSWRRAIVEESGNVLYFPFRIVTMPLVNGFGEPAWENMIRRTRMVFHTEEEFEVEMGPLPEGSGAMSFFLRRLEQAVRENGGPDQWDITLVGHSMGAFVCSEALRIAPSLPVRNVVFMAAACSLREYRDSVVPFLEMPAHADTQMHHLCLSDRAEENEAWPSHWFEVAPRGSLLVWIDSFLSSPATLLDRAAGRYVNLMAAAHLDDSLDDSVRKRISIRQFSSGQDRAPQSPQAHGEFIENVDFWKSDSWKPIEKDLE